MPHASTLQQVQDSTDKTQGLPPTTTASTMQANGYPYKQSDQPLPRYSDYDGSHYGDSHYSVASGMDSDGVWKPPQPVNGGEFEGFDFHHTPVNDVTALNLDTTGRTQKVDGVGRHLLYETALMDTHTYHILEIEEVDALKKEQLRLNSKIDAAQRKLALESKVRDAAQNLQRLYSTTKRPDTPQSPDSPNKKRSSLLPGGRNRAGSTGGPDTFRQADSELAVSLKKVDELHEQIRELYDRRQDVERRLLKHTAAVLAEEANRAVATSVPGLTNGHPYDFDYADSHAMNDFDGIRDILQGKPAGAVGNSKQYDQQIASMQTRLEQLNTQLRNVISEAGQTLGRTPAPELGLDQGDDSKVRIENRFARLERNLHTLEQQQSDFKAEAVQNLRTLEQLEKDEKGIEERMANVNAQLHTAILHASDQQPVTGLKGPPRAGGDGYEKQLQYMEGGLASLEQLLQQGPHSSELTNANAKVEELSMKNREYEATVGGLWDVMQAEPSATAARDGDRDSSSTAVESFSLQAFNTRVQHIFGQAQSAREQQDILRRQIQQQRELGGKSDMEKDSQIDELKRTMEEKQQQLQQLQDNESKHNEIHGRMENLESEIVRLTTELAMAKAELDGAYGTRAQRAGAQAAEVDALVSKNKDITAELESLRTELQGMTNDFQDLTKESITLEKEREQLDTMVDGLRDKCHSLESQLNDERVTRIGLQKTEEKEQRSMLVLKQEFKKMMREQKADAMKSLKAEQEERRKTEAELKKMRQASGPLARSLPAKDETTAPA